MSDWDYVRAFDTNHEARVKAGCCLKQEPMVIGGVTMTLFPTVESKGVMQRCSRCRAIWRKDGT